MTKHRWIAKDWPTPNGLGLQVGAPVTSVTRGMLQVGVAEDGFPILKRGVEVEFTAEPSAAALIRLDHIFEGMERVSSDIERSRGQESAD